MDGRKFKTLSTESPKKVLEEEDHHVHDEQYGDDETFEHESVVGMSVDGDNQQMFHLNSKTQTSPESSKLLPRQVLLVPNGDHSSALDSGPKILISANAHQSKRRLDRVIELAKDMVSEAKKRRNTLWCSFFVVVIITLVIALVIARNPDQEPHKVTVNREDPSVLVDVLGFPDNPCFTTKNESEWCYFQVNPFSIERSVSYRLGSSFGYSSDFYDTEVPRMIPLLKVQMKGIDVNTTFSYLSDVYMEWTIERKDGSSVVALVLQRAPETIFLKNFGPNKYSTDCVEINRTENEYHHQSIKNTFQFIGQLSSKVGIERRLIEYGLKRQVIFQSKPDINSPFYSVRNMRSHFSCTRKGGYFYPPYSYMEVNPLGADPWNSSSFAENEDGDQLLLKMAFSEELELTEYRLLDFMETFFRFSPVWQRNYNQNDREENLYTAKKLAVAWKYNSTLDFSNFSWQYPVSKSKSISLMNRDKFSLKNLQEFLFNTSSMQWSPPLYAPIQEFQSCLKSSSPKLKSILAGEHSFEFLDGIVSPKIFNILKNAPWDCLCLSNLKNQIMEMKSQHTLCGPCSVSDVAPLSRHCTCLLESFSLIGILESIPCFSVGICVHATLESFPLSISSYQPHIIVSPVRVNYPCLLLARNESTFIKEHILLSDIGI